MKTNFDAFINFIPDSIHSNTKTYISENVAVFIPEEFVIDRKIKTEDYHFVIFQSTPPTMKCNNIEHNFKKGCFVCILPGVEMEVTPTESVNTTSYISISINKNFFEDVASQIIDLDKISLISLFNPYSNQLMLLLQLFINEILNYDINCALMIKNLEELIVIQILRDSMPNYLINKKKKITDNDYIEQAIRYMTQYYSSNITIEEICKIIFISPSHFQRIFKHHLRETPHSYLMKIRIKNAKNLLKNKGLNIEEVARLSGFLSLSHFSTVFKRLEGVSPTEYRKGH